MTQHDTREAVEAMARRLDDEHMQGVPGIVCADAAAMLLRLLARAEAAEAALATARADALREAAEAVDHVRNTSLDAYVRGKLLTARMDILALIPKEKPDAE